MLPENIERQLQGLAKQLQAIERGMPTFKFYDLGYVAENKTATSNDIFVIPAATTSEMKGTVEVVKQKVKAKIKDMFGNSSEVETEQCNAVKAKWLPLSSSTENAPFVRRKERVLLYRYSDNDELYWVPTNLDSHLRRLETSTWLFSADPDGDSDNPRSSENSYLFEISTHNKLITMKTTQLNGEPYTHTFQLNTDTGLLVYEDNKGTKFFINSELDQIKAENVKGTYFDIIGERIHAYAPKEIKLESDETIWLKSKQLISQQSDYISLAAKNNYELTAETGLEVFRSSVERRTASYTLEASNYVVKGTTMNVETSTVTFSGTVSATGTFTMSGSAESTGGFKAAAAEFTEEIQANGITSKAPIKGPTKTI